MAKGQATTPNVENLQQQFREYLEKEVNWEPLIPSQGSLPKEERWKRITAELERIAADTWKAAMQGLAAFRSANLDKECLESLETFERYIEQQAFPKAAESISEKQLPTLVAAANDRLKSGEMVEARAMYSFLQLIQPVAIEPLIGLLTIEWEERGAERAADLYGAVVDMIQDPMLDLFAADCFIHAKRSTQAKALLQRSLKAMDEDSNLQSTFEDIEPEMREMLADIENS